MSTKLAGVVARATDVSWGARRSSPARRVLTGGPGSDSPSLPDPYLSSITELPPGPTLHPGNADWAFAS